MSSQSVRTTLSKKNPYYIPKETRLLLKYYCLHVKYWQKELNEIYFKAGTDEWSDPTSKEAIRRVELEHSISIIFESAKFSGGDFAEILFKAVTEDLPYTYIRTHYFIPKDVWYDAYHKFWFVLSRKIHSI